MRNQPAPARITTRSSAPASITARRRPTGRAVAVFGGGPGAVGEVGGAAWCPAGELPGDGEASGETSVTGGSSGIEPCVAWGDSGPSLWDVGGSYFALGSAGGAVRSWSAAFVPPSSEGMVGTGGGGGDLRRDTTVSAVSSAAVTLNLVAGDAGGSSSGVGRSGPLDRGSTMVSSSSLVVPFSRTGSGASGGIAGGSVSGGGTGPSGPQVVGGWVSAPPWGFPSAGTGGGSVGRVPGRGGGAGVAEGSSPVEARGSPHHTQNLNPSSTSLPHLGHRSILTSSVEPGATGPQARPGLIVRVVPRIHCTIVGVSQKRTAAGPLHPGLMTLSPLSPGASSCPACRRWSWGAPRRSAHGPGYRTWG